MKLSLCVVVVMFHRNQAALLSIQLLAVCHVRAVSDNHVQVQVVRGDPVIFNCNISAGNLTQITWTKGKFLFAHRILVNSTFSNFTYQNVAIDPCCLSNLTILNAQHEDTGLYKCVMTYKHGITTTTWNLTVLEKHKENTLPLQLWILIFILAHVIGLLLCGITATVTCYGRSKCLATTSKKKLDFDSRTHSCAQFHVQSGGESLEVTTPQHQSCAEYNRSTRCSQNWSLYYADVQVKAE
ncbi:hypothetical protein JOB18_041624 [Solea senegalensis]|uniref:Ig-like domain-containing protein n=1 Tax=Solea senegalensis TaxID=28829 RepID=A0AAV6RI18_SOLSE|nr:hypothetical protein JOB18_041624 [Solea senegalensis]